MAFFRSSPPPKHRAFPLTVTRSPDPEPVKPAAIPLPSIPTNNGYQNGNNNNNQGQVPKIKVHGQALFIGSPRYPNTFYIDVDDSVEVTKLGCAIGGMGQPEMWTNNKGNGRIEVSYRVGLIGKYKIHITYEGKHIEGSPFNCTLR